MLSIDQCSLPILTHTPSECLLHKSISQPAAYMSLQHTHVPSSKSSLLQLSSSNSNLSVLSLTIRPVLHTSTNNTICLWPYPAGTLIITPITHSLSSLPVSRLLINIVLSLCSPSPSFFWFLFLSLVAPPPATVLVSLRHLQCCCMYLLTWSSVFLHTYTYLYKCFL